MFKKKMAAEVARDEEEKAAARHERLENMRRADAMQGVLHDIR